MWITIHASACLCRPIDVLCSLSHPHLGLLAAIRKGKSLKKSKVIKKKAGKKGKPAASSGGEGISDLFNILKEKRKKMEGDSSSDGNDSDWTTDEEFDDDF